MHFTPDREITIKQAIKEYLDHNSSLGRLSKANVENRTSELERFNQFCAAHGADTPDAIHKNLLSTYIRKLNVSNGTKNTLISVYRSFFDYLVSEGLALDNVAATLSRPKTGKVNPDFLTIDELETVYRWVAENAGKRFVDRNLLLLSIMVEVGLRVSAIISLKMPDVRLDAKQLWIRQKGGDEKQVPITDSIVSQFLNWLEVRKEYKNAAACEYVFMATSGRPLSRHQVYEIVSKALDGAGLVKRRKGPHLLRHTGATLRAMRGDGIEKLRVWLDHTSYTMSQRYVHAAQQLRQETVEDEILKDKDLYRKRGGCQSGNF